MKVQTALFVIYFCMLINLNVESLHLKKKSSQDATVQADLVKSDSQTLVAYGQLKKILIDNFKMLEDLKEKLAKEENALHKEGEKKIEDTVSDFEKQRGNLDKEEILENENTKAEFNIESKNLMDKFQNKIDDLKMNLQNDLASLDSEFKVEVDEYSAKWKDASAEIEAKYNELKEDLKDELTGAIDQANEENLDAVAEFRFTETTKIDDVYSQTLKTEIEVSENLGINEDKLNIFKRDILEKLNDHNEIKQNPAEVNKPVEKAKPIELNKLAEEVKPVKVKQQIEEAKPAKESVEVKNPVEEIKEIKPVEIKKAVEEVKPVEDKKPIEESKKKRKPIKEKTPKSDKPEDIQPITEEVKVGNQKFKIINGESNETENSFSVIF